MTELLGPATLRTQPTVWQVLPIKFVSKGIDIAVMIDIGGMGRERSYYLEWVVSIDSETVINELFVINIKPSTFTVNSN